MATAIVIDVSSSSESDAAADNVPLRRRMSQRKRRLSGKAKEQDKNDEGKVSEMSSINTTSSQE